MTMKRKLDKSIEDKLIGSRLWSNKLKEDCIEQKVFMAIRNNKIGFYHGGGLLFSFDKDGFKTHIKYASVITLHEKDYIAEKDLSNCRIIPDFVSNYARITENCSLYSGIEASSVSKIYHKNSFISDIDIIVLDIEVSFGSFDEDTAKKQDRIDILLYNKTTKTLQFVEAKHFSNKEIWSDTTPKVIGQIKRYENQIDQRKNEIISEYVGYIKTINNLFNLNLPEPEKIDPKVTLLIFGFDKDQLKGRLNDLIFKNSEYIGIKVYAKGEINNLDTKTLWNTKQ